MLTTARYRDCTVAKQPDGRRRARERRADDRDEDNMRFAWSTRAARKLAHAAAADQHQDLVAAEASTGSQDHRQIGEERKL